MKRIVIIMGFVLMGCGVMRAENDTILWINHVIQVVDSAIPVTVSPSDWIGEWKGKMVSDDKKWVAMTVVMIRLR